MEEPLMAFLLFLVSGWETPVLVLWLPAWSGGVCALHTVLNALQYSIGFRLYQ